MCSPDDTLEIIFDVAGASVLAIDEPSEGILVDMTVFVDTKNPGIQAWAYGVSHDETLLTLSSVTSEGTDMKKQFSGGFDATSMEKIESCTNPADPRCAARKAGGGWISAVVLSLGEAKELPIGRSSLAAARYIVQDLGVADTPIVLAFSDRLTRQGSQPVSVQVVKGGRSFLPVTVADGWIVRAENRSFHRGDTDGDGRPTVLDSISLLLFLFLSGPAPGCFEASDFDDDGRMDATDAISILRRLFLEGPPPADPGHGAECGRDPEGSPVNLGCAAYESC